MESYLIVGDPLAPSPSDLIAQTRRIQVGEQVPEGWNVLTGNERQSMIARVTMRALIEFEQDDAAGCGR